MGLLLNFFRFAKFTMVIMRRNSSLCDKTPDLQSGEYKFEPCAISFLLAAKTNSFTNNKKGEYLK